MKQPHTEQSVNHTDDQQNTGNHKKSHAPRPSTPEKDGADRVGGTRAGAANVEPTAPSPDKPHPVG
jgi:hypothetical protein